MSDTPRTDNCLTEILDAFGYVHQGNCPQRWVNHARELERELNAATSEIERLRKANLQLREGAEEQKQRIKRLEGELESTKADRDSWSNQSDEFAKTAADLIIRIKRLEEAGDELVGTVEAMDAWRKAKEAKP